MRSHHHSIVVHWAAWPGAWQTHQTRGKHSRAGEAELPRVLEHEVVPRQQGLVGAVVQHHVALGVPWGAYEADIIPPVRQLPGARPLQLDLALAAAHGLLQGWSTGMVAELVGPHAWHRARPGLCEAGSCSGRLGCRGLELVLVGFLQPRAPLIVLQQNGLLDSVGTGSASRCRKGNTPLAVRSFWLS